MLIGKLSNGDRLMIPVTDAGELSRVFVAADDTIAKRIVIRVVGAGERVCVHTRDQERWASVRMPQLSIVGTPRPAPRTTVGVVEACGGARTAMTANLKAAVSMSRFRPRHGQPVSSPLPDRYLAVRAIGMASR